MTMDRKRGDNKIYEHMFGGNSKGDEVMTEAIENIVNIMQKGYIHDARLENELLELLDEKVGRNMSTLCKYTIDCLAERAEIKKCHNNVTI